MKCAAKYSDSAHNPGAVNYSSELFSEICTVCICNAVNLVAVVNVVHFITNSVVQWRICMRIER